MLLFPDHLPRGWGLLLVAAVLLAGWVVVLVNWGASP